LSCVKKAGENTAIAALILPRVADSTRDELIKARGRNADSVDEDWKPQMDIDEEGGWPHAFCIRHSVPVAEKAKGYVEEIMRKDIDA
jgi:hypothetical protein